MTCKATLTLYQKPIWKRHT